MSEEDAKTEKQNISTYPGDAAEVSWDERLCIHVGECGKAQGELFVGGREPWCQPNLVQIGDVTDVSERCPTGALTYKRKDSGPNETAPEENTITVANDGPLYLRGQLEIDGASEDMDGVAFRAALCRCGQSKNKPFCDNSHRAADFRDPGAIGKSGEGRAAPGGLLKIGKAPNGPLMIKGNVSLVTGNGRLAYQGVKTFLCRCGASKNKPFCDGSHKVAGFTAE